jgi:lipopolysaccharide/colanic/teichoic acid biosynthesis glycosyltransferase
MTALPVSLNWNRSEVVKRSLDIAVAGLALVGLSPLLALIALLIKLDSPGPALFRQQRPGRDMRMFTVLKFRTMRLGSDSLRPQDFASLGYGPDQKKKADPRITRVGRLLRRFSLDELPQFINVLKGDMSLVGPRPFPEYHLSKFSPEFLELRQRVRPGITGLWQIIVRSEGGVEEQEAYDSYNIRNWSVWLDIYILSRTLAAVASGRGAY